MRTVIVNTIVKVELSHLILCKKVCLLMDALEKIQFKSQCSLWHCFASITQSVSEFKLFKFQSQDDLILYFHEVIYLYRFTIFSFKAILYAKHNDFIKLLQQIK